MRITLFKNKYKKTESQPDYRSSQKRDDGSYINIAAGWIRQTRSNEDYLSLEVDLEAAEEAESIFHKAKLQNDTAKIQNTINPDDLPF